MSDELFMRLDQAQVAWKNFKASVDWSTKHYEAKINDLVKEIARRDAIIETDKGLSAILLRTEDNLAGVTIDKDELQDKLQEADRKIADLSLKLEVSRGIGACKEAIIDNLRGDVIDNLRKDVSRLKSEKETLTDKLMMAEVMIGNFSDENERLAEQFRSTTLILENTIFERDEAKANSEMCSNEAGRLQDEINVLKNRHNMNLAELSEVKTELDLVKINLAGERWVRQPLAASCEGRSASLDDENSVLKQEAVFSQKREEELKIDVSRITSKVVELTETLKICRNTIATLEDSIKQQDLTIASVRFSNNVIRDANEAFKNERDKLGAEAKLERDKLEGEIARLQKLVRSMVHDRGKSSYEDTNVGYVVNWGPL